MPDIVNVYHRAVRLSFQVRVKGTGGAWVQRTVSVTERATPAPEPPPKAPPPTPTPPAPIAPITSLSISATTVPSTGGSITLSYSGTNATTCTFSSTPAFWPGDNPVTVNCSDTYTAAVKPSTTQQQWTFTFTATNSAGQSTSSTQTLTELAPPAPPPPTLPVHRSPNWSGYVVGGGPFTVVSGVFNVPNLSVAPTATSLSEWVGIDGAFNTSLIQAGVEARYDPSTNLVRHYAWWEILPAAETIIPMNVSTGDQMSILIGQLSGALWEISITDETTGQNFVTYQTYTGPGQSAEWIVEAPESALTGEIQTLGSYTPNVTFTDTRFAGSATSVTEDVMVQGGATVSTPSAVSSDNSFTVAYGATVPSTP
jgi:hypothetical protein